MYDCKQSTTATIDAIAKVWDKMPVPVRSQMAKNAGLVGESLPSLVADSVIYAGRASDTKIYRCSGCGHRMRLGEKTWKRDSGLMCKSCLNGTKDWADLPLPSKDSLIEYMSGGMIITVAKAQRILGNMPDLSHLEPLTPKLNEMADISPCLLYNHDPEKTIDKLQSTDGDIEVDR